MKDHLRNLVTQAQGEASRWGTAREYLQARILQGFQETGRFTAWAFLGGTALRFLYTVPRFSEDLNFSLVSLEADPGFSQAMHRVARTLAAEGYVVESKIQEDKTVSSAWVRFPGLPFEVGLSPQRTQVLSIKVELDTCPPAGATFEHSLVRRHVLLHLFHHDKGSLLAGKIHALLNRKWLKGRDVYDLIWYLSDPQWPAPNLGLLQSALEQTGWAGSAIAPDTWRRVLWERLDEADWQAVKRDVEPFLENPAERDLISKDVVCRLLAP